MSGMSNRARSLASRLAQKYGAAATLTRQNPGTFNAATQMQSAPTTVVDTLKVVVEDYKAHEVDGESVRYGDKKVMIPVSDLTNLLEPKPGDIIELLATKYRVINVMGISAGDSFAAYSVQVRK